jgi:mRNA-degrading endonuclease RelE of RelBE toxin-antitoxin system
MYTIEFHVKEMKKMYKVEFSSKRVEKELAKFNKKDKELIEEAIRVLTYDPRPVSLQYGGLNRNKEVKRVKCKRARVFYKINDHDKIIYIGKLDNRDSKSYSTDPNEWFAAV